MAKAKAAKQKTLDDQARPPELRVVSFQGRDILGQREFSISPGKVTRISGRNGSGKSSMLTALQAGLGGGNLAKLARIGEDGEEIEPEVVLVLEGGGRHYRVERNAKGVRVRSRVGDTAALEDVPQPQTWLSSLYDTACANPVRILTAPEKELALLILEALPLEYDRAAFLEAVGITEEELRGFGPVPAGVLHPLEETAQIRQSIFRARTGVNRDEKQQRASAEQLKRNIPATPPKDPGLAIEKLDQECRQLAEAGVEARSKADAAQDAAIAKAKHERDLAVAEVRSDFKSQAGKLRREHEQRAAEIRAEAERRIAEDLAATNAAVEAIREGGEVQLSEAEAACERAIEAANREYAEADAELKKLAAELAERREKLVELRAQRDAAAKAAGLIEQAERFEAESDRLRRESERLTAALDRLDARRRQLADELPIPGLEIQDREVRVNGIPWGQLNSGQRVELAVHMSVLRAQGDLPVVFVDGAEQLDREHFDALVQELLRRDIQAFIARVEDHDLEVESHEPTLQEAAG